MDAEVFHSLKNLSQGVASLAELFQTDASRSQWLTVDACGIHADFSRQRINKSLYEALVHSVDVVDVQRSFRKILLSKKRDYVCNHDSKKNIKLHFLKIKFNLALLSKLAF